MVSFMSTDDLYEIENIDRFRESFISQLTQPEFFTFIKGMSGSIVQAVSEPIHFSFNDLCEDDVDFVILNLESFCPTTIPFKHDGCSLILKWSFESQRIEGKILSIDLEWAVE